ncbi:hypothetical protein IK110_02670 [Candidatus Saccharibacteria bacterium]|nr:hypothetical protein [Candidatus Saccharibacteria bacterium]
MRKNNGLIITNGVRLERHELKTVEFLASQGYVIELIQPSRTPNSKTPDFKMIGLEWETKSPIGKGRSTIEHAFQTAARQSENILFDLRRTSIEDKDAADILSKLMNTSRRVKRLGIITKTEILNWYPFQK